MRIEIWHSDFPTTVGIMHVVGASEAAEQVGLCGKLPSYEVYESVSIWFE